MAVFPVLRAAGSGWRWCAGLMRGAASAEAWTEPQLEPGLVSVYAPAAARADPEYSSLDAEFCAGWRGMRHGLARLRFGLPRAAVRVGAAHGSGCGGTPGCVSGVWTARACAGAGRVSWGNGVMAVIGFIGSGLLGTAVARRAVVAGHQVVMSNWPDKAELAQVVRRLGGSARRARPGEVALVADLVVLAIPFHGLVGCRVRSWLGGSCLMPATTCRTGMGETPEIEEGRASTSEVLAERLPYSRVVKGSTRLRPGSSR